MDDHENLLLKLSNLVFKHQGTPMGLIIKKMYFQVLQIQLYGQNNNCRLYDDEEILSMVHGNWISDQEFDSRIGVSI